MESMPSMRHQGDTDVGLAFRLAVGVGILGVFSLFGCASTAPPSEHLSTNPPIAGSDARTPASGAAEEIDPDCPYLTFDVVASSHVIDPDEARAQKELQKPYMEMFSVQLERVGFKLWEPYTVHLRREGFGELATFLESTYLENAEMEYGGILSGHIRELTAREAVELEKIHAKFTTHEEERFEQIFNAPDSSTWLVRSSVLDIGESELAVGLPRGDRILIWHWSMRKQSTVLDGALRIDLFSDPMGYDNTDQFGSISGHSLMMKSDSEAGAAKSADFAARIFLPHARQLCADMSATLLEEEAELERIRDQLTEEIRRVRERRAEQEKRLKLEVEQ